MTPAEASDLLTRCAGFDNRQPSAAAAIAWASALHDIPLDADAYAAVDRYYGTPPKDPNQRLWIQPHDVRRLRRTIRSERVEHFQYDQAGDEAPPELIARYRGQLDALASGRHPHPPTGPRSPAAPPANSYASWRPAAGRATAPSPTPTSKPSPTPSAAPAPSASNARPAAPHSAGRARHPAAPASSPSASPARSRTPPASAPPPASRS